MCLNRYVNCTTDFDQFDEDEAFLEDIENDHEANLINEFVNQ